MFNRVREDFQQTNLWQGDQIHNISNAARASSVWGKVFGLQSACKSDSKYILPLLIIDTATLSFSSMNDNLTMSPHPLAHKSVMYSSNTQRVHAASQHVVWLRSTLTVLMYLWWLHPMSSGPGTSLCRAPASESEGRMWMWAAENLPLALASC